MKKKEAIEAECKENNNLYRKKLKAGKHENVDFQNFQISRNEEKKRPNQRYTVVRRKFV